MKRAYLLIAFLAAITWRLPAPGAQEHILICHSKPAERVTIIAGGVGYFPVMSILQDGTVAVVYRAGAAHIGIHGRLDMVKSSDGGKTWTAPQVVAAGPGDIRNPAFGQLADGTLVLSYSIFKNYDAQGNYFNNGHAYFDGMYTIRSRDMGKTWDQPTKTPLDPLGASPYGRIVQLADGTALVDVVQDEGEQNTWLYRSRDGGKTWGDPTLIGGSHDWDECALAVLPSGVLIAALRAERTRPPGDYLAISFSTDKGYTWTTPTQVTGAHEIPGEFTVLKNGWLLLTYGERNRPYGVQAIISRDGGKTWDDQNKIMLAWDASYSDCGYPKSVQLPSGEILTVYYDVEGKYTHVGDAPADTSAKAIIWSLPNP